MSDKVELAKSKLDREFLEKLANQLNLFSGTSMAMIELFALDVANIARQEQRGKDLKDIKEIVLGFYWWWSNEPGNNMEQAFDEWWKNVKDEIRNGG